MSLSPQQLAEDAKNPWVTPSLEYTTLKVCTYNVCTLLGEDRLTELIAKVENKNWDHIGLCERLIRGEHLSILHNGHA